MERDYESELKEIAGNFSCPADLICYTQALKNFRKVGNVGLETFLECLEEDPHECPFSMPLGGTVYCRCPLRVHVAKKFKK